MNETYQKNDIEEIQPILEDEKENNFSMPDTLTLEQVEYLRASMPTKTQSIDEMVKEAKEAKNATEEEAIEEEQVVIPFIPK